MDTQKDQARSSNLYDQLIDQYKLEAHINQTAVTDLYRAFDVDENRPVAVEILLPTFINKKQFVAQFIDKMNKVAQLKHPNIAQVYQIGLTANNRPYVARDLVEGITLRERLRQLNQQATPSNSIYALKIVRQLAEALELAERLDLYHYHLSPDNIMLKQDGTVVLVDLGIPAAENGVAAHLFVNHNHTPYMAPEQVNGKSVDSRSQIYSLGVILHEILTGELPAEPGSFWQPFLQAINPQNTALEQARPDLSRQTYDLIDKSLRRQSWGRFTNIQEFLEAVNEALQNERVLIQTRGDTAVSTPPPPRRSRVVLLLPLAVLLLGLGGLAVWATAQNRDNAQPTALPIAAEGAAEEIQVPTPTLQQTSAEAETSQEPVANPQTTAVTDAINILAPADAAEFLAGDTANFRWGWDAGLQENQQFSVYLLTENGRSLLGSVNTPSENGVYNLQTLLPDSSSNAISEWQIVLEDLSTNRDVATSRNQRIAIKPAPTTPTFTPAPTNTATPTVTISPTPIPQVEISVSSASLRQGPGTVYPIMRYLYQGDILGVIAKEDAGGEWYNVVLDDGTRGWVAAIACRWLNDSNSATIPIAATIPPRPTNTPTPTPSNTPTPTSTATFTPAPPGGGGGSNPPPTSPPPTFTPPPP